MKGEFIHPGDGGTGILFVHGIFGSPVHFEPFLGCVPENWAVRNIVLLGHGGSAKAIGAVNMDMWREQVHRVVGEMLEENGRFVIAAHSMGCLFAIQEAVRGNASGLFLLAPPLAVGPKVRMFTSALKVRRGNIRDTDVWALAARRAFGLDPNGRLTDYASFIPRYLELFREIRATRPLLPELKVPTRAWFSARDEMVSRRSAALMARSPSAQIGVLTSSGHNYYAPGDLEVLVKDFTDHVKGVFPQDGEAGRVDRQVDE